MFRLLARRGQYFLVSISAARGQRKGRAQDAPATRQGELPGRVVPRLAGYFPRPLALQHDRPVDGAARGQRSRRQRRHDGQKVRRHHIPRGIRIGDETALSHPGGAHRHQAGFVSVDMHRGTGDTVKVINTVH